VIKAFCDRLLERGKAKRAIICAAIHKLLCLAYGVLKSGKPFDSNYTKNLLATPWHLPIGSALGQRRVRYPGSWLFSQRRGRYPGSWLRVINYLWPHPKDGFIFGLQVTQVISIAPTDAPKMISRVGSPMANQTEETSENAQQASNKSTGVPKYSSIKIS